MFAWDAIYVNSFVNSYDFADNCQSCLNYWSVWQKWYSNHHWRQCCCCCFLSSFLWYFALPLFGCYVSLTGSCEVPMPTNLESSVAFLSGSPLIFVSGSSPGSGLEVWCFARLGYQVYSNCSWFEVMTWPSSVLLCGCGFVKCLAFCLEQFTNP